MTEKMARALRIVERLPQLDQDDFARRLISEIVKAHREVMAAQPAYNKAAPYSTSGGLL